MEKSKTRHDKKLAVLLRGNLGVGKTALVQAMVRQWLADDQLAVTSPTFSLIKTYEGNGHQVMHADAYRLTNSDEVAELDLPDYYHRYHCLLEWPERAIGFWPRDYIELTIVGGVGEVRVITLRAEDGTNASGDKDFYRDVVDNIVA